MGSRLRRPLHSRHSRTRSGIQGWEFRIEPHVYSAQHGLSSVVMQRSPSAMTTDREGMDFRLRLHGGRLYLGIAGVGAGIMAVGAGMTGGGGRGWVPASAMTTDGEGMDSCPPSLLGQALLGNCGSGCGNDGWWGKGMGPRIREHNGWGRDGFPPPVFIGQALLGNCGRGCGNDGWGREDGRWGKGMGPRIRDDNGWGRDGFLPPVFIGAGSTWELR